MADQKISELTALTGANLADVDAFAVVDTSAVQTKKITYAELKTALDTGTGFVRITGDTMTGNLIVPQVEIGDGSAGGTSELLFSDNVSARGKIKYNHGSNPEVMTLETTGTVALTIDNAQNATFGGEVIVSSSNLTVNNGNAASKYLKLNASSSGDGHILLLRNNANKWQISSNTSNNLVIDPLGGSSGVNINSNLGLGGTPATNTKLLVKAGTNLNFEVENSSSNLRLSALNDARSANVGMQFASSAFEFLTGATTFNNNVAISSSSGDTLTLTKSTTEPSLRIEGDANKDFVFTVSGELLTLTQNDGATDIVTFDHDTKAATFAGTVTATTLHASSTASTSNSIRISNSEGSFEARVDAGEFYLYDVNDNRIPFLIDTLGRVAIGTTTADAGTLLTVGGAATFTGQNTTHGASRLKIGQDTTAISQIRFYGADTSTAGILQFTGSSSDGTVGGERMRIDSSGNVSIGHSTPNSRLRIQKDGTGNYSNITIDNTNSTGAITFGVGGSGVGNILANNAFLFNQGNSALLFGTNDTERLRIDSLGRVGIGTTAPDNPLEVVGADSGIKISASSSHRPMLRFECGSDEKLILSANGTYGAIGDASDANRYIIFNGGKVLIGKTAHNFGDTGFEFHPEGVVNITRDNERCLNLNRINNGGGHIAVFHSNGSDVGSIDITTSATSYNTSSDYRLKENVDYTWDATTRLKQLKPARFNFIVDDTNTLVDGFLAHEVSSIVPEAITGTKDAVDADGNPEYQGIDQSKLVPLLVKTILELEARITALEA